MLLVSANIIQNHTFSSDEELQPLLPCEAFHSLIGRHIETLDRLSKALESRRDTDFTLNWLEKTVFCSCVASRRKIQLLNLIEETARSLRLRLKETFFDRKELENYDRAMMMEINRRTQPFSFLKKEHNS